jgi:hypothetical protein
MPYGLTSATRASYELGIGTRSSAISRFSCGSLVHQFLRPLHGLRAWEPQREVCGRSYAAIERRDSGQTFGKVINRRQEQAIGY